METKNSIHKVAELDQVLGLATGKDTTATDAQKQSLKDKLGVTDLELKVDRKINILAIGNSYTIDSFSYLPILAKRYGIRMAVTMYYKGGLVLDELNLWFDNNPQDSYVFDNDIDVAWRSLGKKTPKELVSSQEWDIVSLQQGSVASIDINTYAHTDDVVKKIFESLNKQCVLAWNININRDNATGDRKTIEQIIADEEAILANIKDTTDRIGAFSLILPYGTAIFNARTNSSLDALGNSGHLWGDMIHLQEGVPCYIATLANLEAILRKTKNGTSVFGDTWRPTSNEGWNIIDPQNPFIPVTDAYAYLAQKCALAAANNPFVITQITGNAGTIVYTNDSCTLPTSGYAGIRADSNYSDKGKVVTSNGWKYSDFIDITDAKTIQLSVKATAGSFGMAFYSSNDENSFISGVIWKSQSGMQFDIPENAKYMRLSNNISSGDLSVAVYY